MEYRSDDGPEIYSKLFIVGAVLMGLQAALNGFLRQIWLITQIIACPKIRRVL